MKALVKALEMTSEGKKILQVVDIAEQLVEEYKIPSDKIALRTVVEKLEKAVKEVRSGT
jgi:hypothetical protein